MSNITIHQLEPDITKLLEERAAQHGHTIEAEIKAILQSVLASELSPKINLAAAIEQRFANLGDFELPEITREPMRTAPSFEATET
ncbi:FitA-like ribbon-helix-helix domain-containing protein [Anabaena sp. CCY 0017]|uniref:FitA-like ribbon-helix-helix domain-containing protein n=1 Tax=Anabaena sp. CCY 0017 TaxID=3103866 RepID=UPI0039C69A3F